MSSIMLAKRKKKEIEGKKWKMKQTMTDSFYKYVLSIAGQLCHSCPVVYPHLSGFWQRSLCIKQEFSLFACSGVPVWVSNNFYNKLHIHFRLPYISHSPYFSHIIIEISSSLCSFWNSLLFFSHYGNKVDKHRIILSSYGNKVDTHSFIL